MFRRAALALADRVWTGQRKTRIRLQQWSVTVAIYVGSGAAMGAGAAAGWLPVLAWQGWCIFVLLGLSSFYVAIRSGWSERFVDGAMTDWQTVFAVLTAVWGYAMCGDVRSPTLLPLMVILSFGAFSLSWRRIAVLTAFTLVAVAATMVALHRLQPGVLDPRVDIANFVAATVMLPAISVLAGLLGSLRRRLRQQRAELTAALARIHELAVTDDLTQLPNRRHAQALLDDERQRCQRSGRAYAVALVDIDHFKRINDVHGHPAGDTALQAFAVHARSCLRANDVLARWGGEEFLVLMPDTALAAAYEAIDRLRSEVCRTTAQAVAPGLPMTVSAGVAEGTAGEPAGELLARVDRALYAAKQRGRNRVVCDRGGVLRAAPEAACAAAALS